jgi:hypothetical protein
VARKLLWKASQEKIEREANAKATPVQKRWPDGTPKSFGNAFTGQGFTDEVRNATTSRHRLLNGQVPHGQGVIPWDGPQTVRASHFNDREKA